MFRPFGFLTPKDFLFICISNLLTLSVPDECYPRTRFAHLIRYLRYYCTCVYHYIFSIILAGEVGDWKNHFTVAQNERFDQIYNEKMKDIKFSYKYTI